MKISLNWNQILNSTCSVYGLENEFAFIRWNLQWGKNSNENCSHWKLMKLVFWNVELWFGSVSVSRLRSNNIAATLLFDNYQHCIDCVKHLYFCANGNWTKDTRNMQMQNPLHFIWYLIERWENKIKTLLLLSKLNIELGSY